MRPAGHRIDHHLAIAVIGAEQQGPAGRLERRQHLAQAAVDGLYEARWTDEIHAEWMRSLTANVPEIPLERLQATRR